MKLGRGAVGLRSKLLILQPQALPKKLNYNRSMTRLKYLHVILGLHLRSVNTKE